MKKKTRRKYAPEFKEEAVKLITEQGYTSAAAGRNLGINPNLISKWKKEIEGVSSELTQANTVSIQTELKRLRKENKQLRTKKGFQQNLKPLDIVWSGRQDLNFRPLVPQIIYSFFKAS